MSGARLVLLTSAEDDALTGPLTSSLDAWCRAGLLDGVAWARAADLATDTDDAVCGWARGRDWAQAPLRDLASRGLAHLWVAALRGPDGTSERELRTEEDVLGSLNKLLGNRVALRSLTVSATGPGREFRHGDFSAMWDLHLVHDLRVTPDARSVTRDAADADPLALCAAVALCAAGGWSGSTPGMDFVDRVDGPVKHPRVVHAQQRVLHAPDLAFLGMPSTPPWPTPREAGVRRALPGSTPPLSVAHRLARQSGFECLLAPAGDDEPDSGPGVWESLFGRISEPLPRTEAEFALRRLGERTGGYQAPRTDGMVPLRLDIVGGAGHVADLAGHIRQSNFPIGARSTGAEGATPEIWQTVRGTFFGLVDGSPMPEGSAIATGGQGREGEVLVWADPSALAPARAEDAAQPPDEAAGSPATGPRQDDPDGSPADPTAMQRSLSRSAGTGAEAAPPASSSRYRRKFSSSERLDPRTIAGRQAAPRHRRTVWAIAAETIEGAATDPRGSRPADGGTAGRRHSPMSTGGTGGPTAPDAPQHRPPANESAEVGATARAAALDEWLASDEDALPTGGDHDTLMSRLTGSIDGALSRGHRNFQRYAAVRPMSDDYNHAVACRRRSRAVVSTVGLLLAAAVAAVLDQRWPYLAVSWEAATPWEARPAYGPALWPLGWTGVAVAVLGLGGAASSRSLRRLRGALHKLREGEQLRRDCAANSVHYAAELVRLQSLAEQFADHRRIITEMLHRPFGDPERWARSRLDAEALQFSAPPPPSMVVGVANASDERVDEAHRAQQVDLMKRGWMTSAYGEVLEAWRARYVIRVLEDQPDPDADASLPGAAAYRDRRDGSEVLGAREDFARAVAADGWAVTDAQRGRWRQSLTDRPDDDDAAIRRYLDLLEPPEEVHGPVQVVADAADFLSLDSLGEALSHDQVSHRFSWTEMLSPSAAAVRPAVSAAGSGDAPVVAATGDGSGAMVLMSWRLEYSAQVRAEDLQGWTSADDVAPTPTGGVI